MQLPVVMVTRMYVPVKKIEREGGGGLGFRILV